jgi:heme-degrading monooxygenase HmoA
MAMTNGERMIHELARFEIKTGSEADFEAAFEKARPLFGRAKGMLGADLRRSAEHPSVYWLIIGWETIENHMVDFRESEDFTIWRGLVSACFATAPVVEHAVPLAG